MTSAGSLATEQKNHLMRTFGPRRASHSPLRQGLRSSAGGAEPPARRRRRPGRPSLVERLDQAGLAFLSACGTAQNRLLPDESLNLLSAFQLASFSHLVGSLWPVTDQANNRLVKAFYEHLTGQQDASVAESLHHAVSQLREREPERPSLWAPLRHRRRPRRSPSLRPCGQAGEADRDRLGARRTPPPARRHAARARSWAGSLAEHMRADLVVDAVQAAVDTRCR
ncbi:CHAT domain-containing protein [Streptomyces sp. SPB074]